MNATCSLLFVAHYDKYTFFKYDNKKYINYSKREKTTQKYKTNMSVVNVERVRSIDQLKEALVLSQSQTLKLERERG